MAIEHEFELQKSTYTWIFFKYIVYHYMTNCWLNLPCICRFLTAQRVGIPLFPRVSCAHFILWYTLSVSCQIVSINILNATGFEFGI